MTPTPAPGLAGLRWGVVAQVKASLVAVQTFVAWHLQQGATQIWIYFDDPDDPAAKVFGTLKPHVQTRRCRDEYWAGQTGKRSEKKTVRQAANALHAYCRMKVDWLAHIDVDEFILPLPGAGAGVRSVAQVLTDELGEDHDRIALRLRPYEALTEPEGGPPGHFRAGPLGSVSRAKVSQAVYGRYVVGLGDGMLSHSVGKCFCRTGVEGLAPRIHGPWRHGERLDTGDFVPGLALLHYHATNRQDWLDHVGYRATKGAYSARPEARAFFETADQQELLAFYAAVQVASPDLLARLDAEQLLLAARPQLEESRARLFGPVQSV